MNDGLVVTSDPDERVAVEPLIAAVEHRLSAWEGASGERPRLVRTSFTNSAGVPSVRFDVALAADLILPVEHIARTDIADADQPADVAKLVGHAVDANWPRRRELAAVRSEMLRAAEGLAVVARSRGIDVGDVAVELTARSSWTAAAADRFAVSFNGIDDRLMPAPIVRDVAEPSSMRAEFAWEFAKLRRRLQARDACAPVGGVAWSDELTLRAISQLGGEAEAPSPFAGPVVLAAPDLVLFWHQGVLRSLYGMAGGAGWCGTTMSIAGWSLPDTLITASRGRPVTELVGHALLSDRIVIADIANRYAFDGPTLEISLDTPLVAIDAMARPVAMATDILAPAR